MQIHFNGMYTIHGKEPHIKKAMKAIQQDAQAKDIPVHALTSQLSFMRKRGQGGSVGGYPTAETSMTVGPVDRVNLSARDKRAIGLERRDDGQWYFPGESTPIYEISQTIRLFTGEDALKLREKLPEYKRMRAKNHRNYLKMMAHWDKMLAENAANSNPKDYNRLNSDFLNHNIMNNLLIGWRELHDFVEKFVKHGHTYSMLMDAEEIGQHFGPGKAAEFKADGTINHPQRVSY